MLLQGYSLSNGTAEGLRKQVSKVRELVAIEKTARISSKYEHGMSMNLKKTDFSV